MTRIVKINTSTKSTTTFSHRYPIVTGKYIPQKYKTVPIDFREAEIKDYDIIFFHRMLKRIYGSPSHIEVEEHPTKKGGIGHLGCEWKYFLSTKFKNMILIETKDLHTSIVISHVLRENNQLSEKAIKEGEKFINALLQEAKKLGKQILNPKKEFEEEGIQMYLLHNVYLYNYKSAELMFEYCESNENEIREKFLTYDPRVDFVDSEKEAYVEKFMSGVGMYYASAIFYYIMALEGFVNLIYHAFMKPEFRDRELNLEERFDIEQKIRLITSLCDGFKKHLDRKSTVLQNFKHLKKYRNQIFHSKIQDSLKTMSFFESGFLYTVNMDKYKDQFLPPMKINLDRENVLFVKSIVDDTISDILTRMTNKYKNLTNEFIMKKNQIPFWKDKSGCIRLGTLSNSHEK